LSTLYLDTALLVATLVHEQGTAVAHRFLQQVSDRPWLISHWVDAELASALAIQRRRAVISQDELNAAWQRYRTLRQERLQVLALETVDFKSAARLCHAESAPLRAGDALHLALCLRHRITLVSFDRSMCAAAAQHRIEVELLVINS
jgi:predicted nucleic acid-binding protein